MYTSDHTTDLSVTAANIIIHITNGYFIVGSGVSNLITAAKCKYLFYVLRFPI